MHFLTEGAQEGFEPRPHSRVMQWPDSLWERHAISIFGEFTYRLSPLVNVKATSANLLLASMVDGNSLIAKVT